MLHRETVVLAAGAADIIREKGWARGGFTDDQNRVCVQHALSGAVLGALSLWQPWEISAAFSMVTREIMEVVREQYPEVKGKNMTLAFWNDHWAGRSVKGPRTSISDADHLAGRDAVLAILDKVAAA